MGGRGKRAGRGREEGGVDARVAQGEEGGEVEGDDHYGNLGLRQMWRVGEEGLSEWAVRSPNEVYALMQKGA